MTFANIHTLLIDLDNTLYPHSNGIWRMIRDRIHQFLLEELHFPEDEVDGLRHRLWQQYGTTLRGLQTEFAVDMDAYLAYVHDVPLEMVITLDPPLADALRKLPQRKVIFTNGSADHAHRVMSLLGVGDVFEAVIDIYAMAPYCKPQRQAFEKALAVLGEAAESSLLFDDTPDNLDMAQQMGMATVSVGKYVHVGSPHIDVIQDIASVMD